MATKKSDDNKWWLRMKPSPVKANSLDSSNKGTMEFNWKRLFGKKEK